MTGPVVVPPGHPWSCPGCQITASVVIVGAMAEVQLAHDDDCKVFAARLWALAPDLEQDDAFTIRLGGAADRAAVEHLFPRW